MMNNAVILAGGQGKRMKADIPKPMFKVLEEPMLEWVIKACEEAELSNLCIVKGYMAEKIDEYLNGRYETVLQSERLGTGHAVMQAVPFMEKNGGGHTLVPVSYTHLEKTKKMFKRNTCRYDIGFVVRKSCS